MARKKKIRICSETEKKKVELINHVDKLISTNRWNEAENILRYLYRTTPRFVPSINYKFSALYFKQKKYTQALVYLQQLIPTTDFRIYALLIPSLKAIGEERYALLELAKSPLSVQEKQNLFSKFFKRNHLRSQPVFNFRCSRCNNPLFLIEKKAICLECNPSFILRTNI